MSRSPLAITRLAVRSLAQMDKPLRRQVQTAIDTLGSDQRPAGAAALTGEPDVFRLRVGDVAVLYEIRSDGQVLVLVVEPAPRLAGTTPEED